MIDHPSYDELTEYLDDPENHPRRAEIKEHLETCDRCKGLAAVGTRFTNDVHDELLWQFVATAQKRAQEMPERLRFAAGLRRVEDSDAREYLSPIVYSPAAFARARITEQPAARTAGVVRLLCGVAHELCEKNTPHAATLAAAAVVIAERLDSTRYDGTTRNMTIGGAWLEHAIVLRLQGAFAAAEEALDNAEAAYRQTAIHDRPLAFIGYVRSVLYMKSERVVEAARLARRVARVFKKHGDDDRFLHAMLVTGMCLVLERKYAEAHDLFLKLLPEAQRIDPGATVARCIHNLAKTELELGRPDDARELYAEALGYFQRLELPTEAARARWGIATTIIRSGNIPEGVARLRKEAATLRDMGLITDYALATLDMVEALFAIGELAELPAICSSIVRVFTEAKMHENARAALAYLSEAMRAGTASTILLDSVKTYIEREYFVAPFTPPPPE